MNVTRNSLRESFFAGDSEDAMSIYNHGNLSSGNLLLHNKFVLSNKAGVFLYVEPSKFHQNRGERTANAQQGDPRTEQEVRKASNTQKGKSPKKQGLEGQGFSLRVGRPLDAGKEKVYTTTMKLFFRVWGLYGVYPFQTCGVYPCPLFSQGNGIHHSCFPKKRVYTIAVFPKNQRATNGGSDPSW